MLPEGNDPRSKLRIDTRWATTKADELRRHAAELAALAPDVLVAATGSATVAPLLQATRTVPIVFVVVIGPVGAGFVASLAHPGGNATGFTMFEYGLSGKWLELLKQIAPSMTRAAVLRDPAVASGIGQFAAVQAVAPSLGVELSPVGLHDAGAIEPAVAAFAHGANGGLVMTASPFGGNHPDVITTLAARYKLPAVYPFRYFVNAGGLMSYGSDLVSQFRSAAQYVDRILKDVAGYRRANEYTPDIVEKLNKEINAVLADPTMEARFANFGYTAFASSSAEFGKFIAEDIEKWAKVVKFAGIKPE